MEKLASNQYLLVLSRTKEDRYDINDASAGKVWLLVSLYNFVMPHKSLRQGRIARTPAMAIGLTDHVWSYREYIWLPVHTDLVLAKQMEERLARLLIPALQDQPVGRTQAPPAGKTNKKEATPLPKAA